MQIRFALLTQLTDPSSLDRLESFLDKYYSGDLTVDDLRNLNVDLSLGPIRCTEVQEL